MQRLNQIQPADYNTIDEFVKKNYNASKFFIIMQDDDYNANCLSSRDIFISPKMFRDMMLGMGYDNFKNLLSGLRDFINHGKDKEKNVQVLEYIKDYLSERNDGNESDNVIDITQMLTNAGFKA